MTLWKKRKWLSRHALNWRSRWSHPIPDPLLHGVRVVDLADERGLVAGRLLADLGADVVMNEPTTGSTARQVPPFHPNDSQASLYWETFAANRRSVSLADDGLARIMDRADIIIVSGTPAQLLDQSRDPQALHRHHPEAIITVITPFGMNGPKRDYADTDLILWAAGGPLEPHRAEADGRPLRPSVPQAYLHAGADAAGGALLAYLAKLSGGGGQIVDVSVQACLSQATLARVLSIPVGDPRAHKPQQPLTGLDRSGSGAATSGTFKKWQCKDGLVELHLAMGPSSGRFTNNFFEWVDSQGSYPAHLPRWDWPTLPDLIQRGEFTNEDLDAVREVTRDFLASRTRREINEAAIEHRLLCVGINGIPDIADEAHFKERDVWSDVDSLRGNIRLVAQWAQISDGFAPRVNRRAPEVGEHTDEVMREWLATP